MTSHRPVNPYPTQFAPAAGIEHPFAGVEGAPGDIPDHQCKRRRPEEEHGNDSRVTKRTAAQAHQKDSSMSFSEMIKHIMYVACTHPTVEQQKNARVPKKATFFAISNFAPHASGHPDNFGRADPAFCGSNMHKNLGCATALGAVRTDNASWVRTAPGATTLTGSPSDTSGGAGKPGRLEVSPKGFEDSACRRRGAGPFPCANTQGVVRLVTTRCIAPSF
jgi:hypothetical protein